jgi:hypothetical protein
MESTLARDRIEALLRKRICSVCIGVQADGSCGLPAQYPCSLFRHLDRVINLVAQTHADPPEVCTHRLREQVCSNCRLDLISGDCSRPADQVCPLETHFPLVVEVIESEIAVG